MKIIGYIGAFAILAFLMSACQKPLAREISFAGGGLEMPLGASIYPDVYARPSRAEIVFSSSDESVFVVMGSQIKSVGEGEALLTASSLDGTVSASCVVRVDRTLGIGSFTVNQGGKIISFATGNLQGEVLALSPDVKVSWKLADRQSHYLGVDSCNEVPEIGKTADLFGRSKTSLAYGVGTGDSFMQIGVSESGAAADWCSDIGGLWRVLDDDEWRYLAEKRRCSKVGDTENARFCRAVVDGISGLVLFPDVMIWPEDIPVPKNINEEVLSISSTGSYGNDEWCQLENSGCIFLPACGYKDYEPDARYGVMGSYWASGVSGSWRQLSCFYFDEDDVSYLALYLSKPAGCAVRLARDL